MLGVIVLLQMAFERQVYEPQKIIPRAEAAEEEVDPLNEIPAVEVEVEEHRRLGTVIEEHLEEHQFARSWIRSVGLEFEEADGPSRETIDSTTKE